MFSKRLWYVIVVLLFIQLIVFVVLNLYLYYQSDDVPHLLLRNKNIKSISRSHLNLTTFDINMLDVYRGLPFNNKYGGVWTQGFPLSYNENYLNTHKLKVFVVPHSHNDPGWLRTFDAYYRSTTQYILSNILTELTSHKNLTFIWAEISYFSRWYEGLTGFQKTSVKKLIDSKRLEIVSGGWVMPDEANTHWYTILEQFYEGHSWLKSNLNVTPTNSWAIDPFGHTPTMAYLLKSMDFNNMLIQRTHYEVKKYLSKLQQLEFIWHQTWDTNKDAGMFTHMMPFQSYAIRYTCGPDPDVCCQFDYRKNCGKSRQSFVVTDDNIAERSSLIADQWRKKSMLYQSKAVLVPLGDDFRYLMGSEWIDMRTNFERIFNYINKNPAMNMEVKFGTLDEYFKAVHSDKELSEFPTLTGDFFTYADRDDHYWSGYFSTRPFHKRIDRILLTYLRSAEILHSWIPHTVTKYLNQQLTSARRALSLFQHHDGITGTARESVVQDYADQMFHALSDCKLIIQQCAYWLLQSQKPYRTDPNVICFNIDETWENIIYRPKLNFTSEDSEVVKYIVVHNSLPHERTEVIEMLSTHPAITILSIDNIPIDVVITPIWNWPKWENPVFDSEIFKVLCKVTVPAFSLAVFKARVTFDDTRDSYFPREFAEVTFYSDDSRDRGSPLSYPKKITYQKPRPITITMNGYSYQFDKYGLLRAIKLKDILNFIPVKVNFLKYKAAGNLIWSFLTHTSMSGAYIFRPDGTAGFVSLGYPNVIVCESNLETRLIASFPFGTHEYRINNDGIIEIRNVLDITLTQNTELVMRITTDIQSRNIFYTDLNGLQIIKRERFEKLPIQGNYYPVPSSILIEDSDFRLTLLTGQPLGGSSLKSGEIEVIQDRRLMQDDNRGLGQGVQDNVPTMNTFKLILELRGYCDWEEDTNRYGALSEKSHLELQTLLHPIEKLFWIGANWDGMNKKFGHDIFTVSKDVVVPVIRSVYNIELDKRQYNATGLIIHRTNIDQCFPTSKGNTKVSVNLTNLINLRVFSRVFKTNPNLVSIKEVIGDPALINLDAMELKSFMIFDNNEAHEYKP